MEQKFKPGDYVMVAKDLGPYMTHFTGDCEAIVIHSYADKYGGDDTKSYCIHIKGKGQTSWYKEHQLELIETNKGDLLAQWEVDAKQESDMKSNLDWIFSHGEEVLKGARGATIEALAKCFGLTNLWGRRGEGYVYYENAHYTLGIAKPFLKSGDKAGWLEYCNKIKEAK